MEFEGEFLYNKKWNGKGFDKNGNIVDELINGKGSAKEYYYYNGKLVYEGEYLNGKRNGKGKEYLEQSGELIYEGEYLNGKWNGKGKEYIYLFNGGELVFEGEYLNGKRWNGKGKEFHKKGVCQYLNGKIITN